MSTSVVTSATSQKSDLVSGTLGSSSLPPAELTLLWSGDSLLLAALPKGSMGQFCRTLSSSRFSLRSPTVCFEKELKKNNKAQRFYFSPLRVWLDCLSGTQFGDMPRLSPSALAGITILCVFNVIMSLPCGLSAVTDSVFESV